MSNKWDYNIPSVEFWKEAIRVLKPGGHALIFCGTRTQHRMVCNIEDAGFEIRDVITWLYGSGFPKSLNIGKALDKALGNSRDIAYEYTVPDIRGDAYGTMNEKQGGSYNPLVVQKTVGHSEWEGWGTALKPACEFITLARKPISEKTVVSNIMKWRTGAINIDESRIELNGEIVPINVLESWSGFGQEDKPDYTPTENTQGRWPANLILDSEAGALLDKQKEGASRFFKSIRQEESFTWEENNLYVTSVARSLGITRAIEQTEIIPFALLNVEDFIKRANQSLNVLSVEWKLTKEETELVQNLVQIFLSGERESITLRQLFQRVEDLELMQLHSIILGINNLVVSVEKKKPLKDIIQIMQSLKKSFGFVDHAICESITARFCYVPKPSQRERNAGLEGEEKVKSGVGALRDSGRGKEAENFHPTVKPIALMEYLIRLITPKDGTVLDPFMGSGTTGIASKNLGNPFTGIELSPEYYELAVKRIERH